MLEVLNSHGAKIDYAAAVELMDDDTREAVTADLAPCTEQELFTAYAAAHLAKFGEVWELDKTNPVYSAPQTRTAPPEIFRERFFHARNRAERETQWKFLSTSSPPPAPPPWRRFLFACWTGSTSPANAEQPPRRFWGVGRTSSTPSRKVNSFP